MFPGPNADEPGSGSFRESEAVSAGMSYQASTISTSHTYTRLNCLLCSLPTTPSLLNPKSLMHHCWNKTEQVTHTISTPASYLTKLAHFVNYSATQMQMGPPHTRGMVFSAMLGSLVQSNHKASLFHSPQSLHI